MTCREATRLLCEGTGAASDAALARHLLSCPACRDARVAVAALRRAGEDARAVPLSADAARRTRAEAARLLARRREVAVRAWAWGGWPRWAAAAVPLAAALVLVAGLFVAGRTGRPARAPDPAFAGEMAMLDSRIEALRRSLDNGVRSFALSSGGAVGAEAQADGLRRRIERRLGEVEAELGEPIRAGRGT